MLIAVVRLTLSDALAKSVPRPRLRPKLLLAGGVTRNPRGVSTSCERKFRALHAAALGGADDAMG